MSPVWLLIGFMHTLLEEKVLYKTLKGSSATYLESIKCNACEW